MRLITSEKAKRPRLRALLWETANIARELGVDPTDLEVRVYGGPPGKRSFGVFQYVKLVKDHDGQWRKVCGRILLQPRRGASDPEIVMVPRTGSPAGLPGRLRLLLDGS